MITNDDAWKILDNKKRFQFIQIPKTVDERLIADLGKSIAVWLYMYKRITRNGKKNNFWGREIYPHYLKNELPFSQAEWYIGEYFDWSQQGIAKHIVKLKNFEIIKDLGTATFNEKSNYNVWSMGIWLNHDMRGYIEISYLEYVSHKKYKKIPELVDIT